MHTFGILDVVAFQICLLFFSSPSHYENMRADTKIYTFSEILIRIRQFLYYFGLKRSIAEEKFIGTVFVLKQPLFVSRVSRKVTVDAECLEIALKAFLSEYICLIFTWLVNVNKFRWQDITYFFCPHHNFASLQNRYTAFFFCSLV